MPFQLVEENIHKHELNKMHYLKKNRNKLKIYSPNQKRVVLIVISS